MQTRPVLCKQLIDSELHFEVPVSRCDRRTRPESARSCKTRAYNTVFVLTDKDQNVVIIMNTCSTWYLICTEHRTWVYGFRLMVFNATFNNISVISWRSVLLVDETELLDRMVVEFTTTYAISAYYHCCCEFESPSGRGVHHYVIKFVSDLRQVGGFLRVIRFHPPIKLTATI
jgi:hypothetical protein